MSDLHSELADLALSISKDAQALYAASATFTPLAKKAEAMVIVAGMRSKQRRWRRLMGQLIVLETAQRRAEAERRTMLDAENARLAAQAVAA